MDDLRSKSLNDLKKELKLPAYKIEAIFRLIHHSLKEDINELTSISLDERKKLAENYSIVKLKPVKVQTSQGVKKVAFELEDGKVIESVLMEFEKERKTVCLSVQVGCPVACLFCATGRMGFKRNLTIGEILGQVYYFAKKAKISNIVFMGMGEPFLNYINVIKAARLLNHSLGQNIAARKITISTIGISSGIKKFTNEREQFRLAWSLVTPFDYNKIEISPHKQLESIDKIVKALRDYQQKTKRRITIEYLVLEGVNDSVEDGKELVAIAKKLDSHVNLIPYNESPKSKFKPGNVGRLQTELHNAHINVTVRRSLGADISAACGQLSGS